MAVCHIWDLGDRGCSTLPHPGYCQHPLPLPPPRLPTSQYTAKWGPWSAAWFVGSHKRNVSSMSLPRGRLDKVWSGAGVRASKELRFQFLGTCLPPEDIGVISPKASMCSVCDTLEMSRVSFVQHCLINFLLASFHL